MRTRPILFALICLALAACSEPPVPGVDSDTVEALRAEVATLRQDVNRLQLAQRDWSPAITGLSMDIAALKKQACKVPHLFGVDGIDLGPFAGYDVAWSEQLGAYYRISAAVGVRFRSRDCTGDPVADAITGYDYAVGSNSHIVALSGKITKDAALESSMLNGECFAQSITTDIQEMTDTGIAARIYSRGNLRVH